MIATIKDLKKGDKFTFNDVSYTVSRKWINDNNPLIAYDDDKVIGRSYFWHEGLVIYKVTPIENIYTLSDMKEAFEAGTYWNGKYHKQQDMIGSDPMKVPDFEKWFEEFKSKLKK